ncbi:peptidylprolyl isomerase, partial [Azotobacter chroococcum]|nr:peptidylprolyl isomerase [Azotobacter chroococcum]
TPHGWGYAVFGEVVEGMDVVDRIKAVATGSRAGHGDVPVDDVIIEKAEIVE